MISVSDDHAPAEADRRVENACRSSQCSASPLPSSALSRNAPRVATVDARPQPLDDLDPAAAALAGDDVGRLEAVGGAHEHDVAAFDGLHGLLGQRDAGRIAAARPDPRAQPLALASGRRCHPAAARPSPSCSPGRGSGVTERTTALAGLAADSSMTAASPGRIRRASAASTEALIWMRFGIGDPEQLGSGERHRRRAWRRILVIRPEIRLTTASVRPSPLTCEALAAARARRASASASASAARAPSRSCRAVTLASNRRCSRS